MRDRLLHVLVLVALLGSPVVPASAEEPQAEPASCLDRDKTGMPWVHPFKHALAKAKAEGRLLMIKPVAFGTTPDGGW